MSVCWHSSAYMFQLHGYLCVCVCDTCTYHDEHRNGTNDIGIFCCYRCCCCCRCCCCWSLPFSDKFRRVLQITTELEKMKREYKNNKKLMKKYHHGHVLTVLFYDTYTMTHTHTIALTLIQLL